MLHFRLVFGVNPATPAEGSLRNVRHDFQMSFLLTQQPVSRFTGKQDEFQIETDPQLSGLRGLVMSDVYLVYS
jgi:hypothetical protein